MQDDAPTLPKLAGVFVKIGILGFGGPAAHIARMEEETVRRRGWISAQDFLDLVGATNLIPGPNSTEMAIHLGLRLKGWAGLLVSGICFITPAAMVTAAIAWFYVLFAFLLYRFKLNSGLIVVASAGLGWVAQVLPLP